MQIYYDFHCTLPPQQLSPLIEWCIDLLTDQGSIGSYDLRQSGADPTYWMLTVEVWDQDQFTETVMFPEDAIGPNLTDSWLVLLTEERDGRHPPLDLNDDGVGDYEMELSEIICHLMTPDSIGKSWGDGRNAIVFNKKDSAHVPICNALKRYDPTELQAEYEMKRKQLSLFPEENKPAWATP